MVAPAQLVSQSHEARFSVKTMGREDGGEYICLYQLTGQVNSTASQPVHITVIGEETAVGPFITSYVRTACFFFYILDSIQLRHSSLLLAITKCTAECTTLASFPTS